MTSDAGDAAAPEDLASAVAAAMLARDAASAALGIELIDVARGHAHARMLVRADMVQGHGLCHGGFVFALCDTAFALASNAHADGPTVSVGADIVWVRPAHEGDVLIAEAVEHTRYGRNGISDVNVTRLSDGAIIARFRGRSLVLTDGPASRRDPTHSPDPNHSPDQATRPENENP